MYKWSGVVLLAFMPAAFASSDLILAPGKSITVLDAASPWLRVVLTAPDDAPLDVGALLDEKSVSALATAAQAKRAAGLVQHDDGSISLAAATPAASDASFVHGGVLVLDGGKLSLHPESVLSAQPRPADAPSALNTAREELVAIPGFSARSGAVPALPAPVGALNVSPGTISFGSISISSGGSITAGSTGSISTGSGSIQITSPNGVTLQSGGSISVGGTSIAPTGIGTTGGSITAR